MTTHERAEVPRLDPDRVRELFDLRGAHVAYFGGGHEGDVHGAWRDLRAAGAVHEGTLHRLSGLTEEIYWHGLPYPERPHFTVFSHAGCDAAFRAPDVFSSSPDDLGADFEAAPDVTNSMLTMGGSRHRRYRQLVQPSFLPGQVGWWMRGWIEQAVEGMIDNFVEAGRAELNVDFCAAIPVLTITGSFGVPVERALDIRAATRNPDAVLEIIRPIIAARRESPQDDLISILVESEIVDEEGQSHRLSDAEVESFALLLLQAGSGTTWKQMGIVLTTLLEQPHVLSAITADRSLLKPAIEETLRWEPTDPMFSRWVTADTELEGTTIPAGSVVHLALAAGNRDPRRWDDPDRWDPSRPAKASLAFGGGPHICLGMHVARAEMLCGINALLDRLPHLRLDPEQEPPRIVGFYERGATAIPVLFG